MCNFVGFDSLVDSAIPSELPLPRYPALCPRPSQQHVGVNVPGFEAIAMLAH